MGRGWTRTLPQQRRPTKIVTASIRLKRRGTGVVPVGMLGGSVWYETYEISEAFDSWSS